MASLASRSLSTFSVLRASLSQSVVKESASHNHESFIKWRNLFFFICCPAMVLSMVNFYMSDHEHRAEFKNYPYLRIRNRAFPWRDGVKTLFHNPETNALPNGYEN